MSEPPTNAALPAYQQIEQALSAEIAQLHPGDAIPTEQQLCTRFGVSRMTARAGVARLVERGLLYRVRGSGTFVSRPPVHRQSGRLLSFSEDMHARGLTPSSRILEIGQHSASPETCRQLALAAGARVVLIKRARFGDEIPMAVERALLIPDCAPSSALTSNTARYTRLSPSSGTRRPQPAARSVPTPPPTRTPPPWTSPPARPSSSNRASCLTTRTRRSS